MPQLIRSACLTDYAEIARSVGLEPYRMLAAAGLPAACLAGPDMMIPAGAVGRLLEASAKAAGIDDFGLRLAERRGLSNLGPVGLVVREQPTIREAIEALIRYGRLHNEALQLRLEKVDDLAVVSPVLLTRRPVPMRQAVELTIGVLYRILRVFLGDAWKPQAICFVHRAPRDRRTHRRVFAGRLEFDSERNGIVCTDRDLDAPVPAADPTMARYVQGYLETIVARSGTTTAEKVRELVWVLLPSGRCSVEQVARRLGVDRRSVHRYLAREGTSFSAILDAARIEMVTRYIGEPGKRLYVVAELLGFSALSAFSRWFRHRFGCSVSTWRARQA